MRWIWRVVAAAVAVTAALILMDPDLQQTIGAWNGLQSLAGLFVGLCWLPSVRRRIDAKSRRVSEERILLARGGVLLMLGFVSMVVVGPLAEWMRLRAGDWFGSGTHHMPEGYYPDLANCLWSVVLWIVMPALLVVLSAREQRVAAACMEAVCLTLGIASAFGVLQGQLAPSPLMFGLLALPYLAVRLVGVLVVRSSPARGHSADSERDQTCTQGTHSA
jgi:hypothetical protein